MKPYYVMLTGSKNNAGDFLIKHRAKALLSYLRPDRDVIDIDAWNKFDAKTLQLVNNSICLILMGGPALQKDMYPKIYPLVDNLDEITTEIILMGVGWKSTSGHWHNTRQFEFSEATEKLLLRLGNSIYNHSVRDYHSLNVLNNHGVSNVTMTGCPAAYDLNYINRHPIYNKEIKKVAFSLGVSFLLSKKMEQQMKKMIISVRDYFSKNVSDIELTVVFHHSTKNRFLMTHNAKASHLSGHNDFINWLENNNLQWVDISGSAENLINFYSQCDLHIGYRVHAHIFMLSINRLSILITEDSRGIALPNVLGGIILEGFEEENTRLIDKIFRRLNIKDKFYIYENLDVELINSLNYEISHDYPRIRKSRFLIDDNYLIMQNYINNLP